MAPKNVFVARQARAYDAIVVGSGITGGYAAKELCELGLETLVLERGRNVEHGTDYVTEHKPTWAFPARNSSDGKRYTDVYPVQSRTYAFGEHSEHFFIKDKENPYIEVKPFTWIRGDHVGGRSLMWGRQCYRWSEMDFEANARDFQIGAVGELPGLEDAYYIGNRPNGIYVPRFRNVSPQTKRSDYLRGFGYQGSASRPSWGRPMKGFGADFKHALREPGPWEMRFSAFGETLPRYDNLVALDPEQTDPWGIPLLRISCEWGENEMAMRPDMAESAAEMLDAAGAKNIRTFNNYNEDGLGAEPGLGIHEMGTARMGRDPKTSVLNGHNQCHDVPNVFVTDGACMASSACQNPSITYMALTARAAHFAVDELKKMNL